MAYLPPASGRREIYDGIQIIQEVLKNMNEDDQDYEALTKALAYIQRGQALNEFQLKTLRQWGYHDTDRRSDWLDDDF